MAAITGGVAAALGGAALATATAPSGFDVPGYGAKKGTFLSVLQQFQQAGGDISKLQVTKVRGKGSKGKWRLPDGTIVSRADTLTIGNQRFAFGGPAAHAIFQGQLETDFKRQTEQKQKTYDSLFGAEGPQFLKDLLTNRPQQIRDAFASGFDDRLRGALGAAAPAGTLTTEAIQRQATAPVALESERFFQGVQDSVNAAQLGITGIPGFGTGFPFDPSNISGPQSQQTLQQIGLASAGLNSQIGLANAQSGFQSDLFKSGIYGGLGSGLSESFFSQEK